MIEETKQSISKGVDKTVEAAETTASKPLTQKLARFGFFTKGVLYIIIGALAALAAVGSSSGELSDQRGVLETISGAPFGKFLLFAVLIGAVGYGLWSILRGVADVDGKGSDAKALITRAGFVGIGVFYFLFAWSAWGVLQTSSAAKSGSLQETYSRTILDQPLGMFLLIVIGLVIVGVGSFEIYQAATAKFTEFLDLNSLDEKKRRLAIGFGRFGHAARGVVFAIIGFFVITAAWYDNPNKVRGLDGALAALAAQNYGVILLFVTALGLICYGLLEIVEAKYRRFGAPVPHSQF